MSNGKPTGTPPSPRASTNTALTPLAPSPGRERAAQLTPMERASPKAFIQARAHLAATLTDATTTQLGQEIHAARAKVNTWQGGADHPVTPEQGTAIMQQTLQNDYSVLKRFQSEAAHSTPHKDVELSAVQQVRALHGGSYKGDPADAAHSEPDHFGAAVIGARHTAGQNKSPFVSLASDPSQLLVSADDGATGARTIARKAAQLHTYTVPKVFTWSAERLRNTIASQPDYLDTAMAGHNTPTFGNWLQSTPAQETEVLFHGGDLARYRTGQERNPNLPPITSRKRRGRKR